MSKEIVEMEVVGEEVVNQEVQKEEEGPKPNALLITIELANALVNYLSEKPLKEVEELVNAIRGSRSVTVTENPEAEEAKEE